MPTTKEVSLSIDVAKLKEILERQKEETPKEEEVGVRSTIFSLGKDPRLGSKQQISVPDLKLLEILKDGLDNPYIELNWRVTRYDIDSNNVIGFNVYRRKISRERVLKETRYRNKRARSFSRNAFDKISKKNKRRGKFSAEKKSISNIRRSLIPRNILNPNLDKIEKDARSRFNSSLNRNFNTAGRRGRFASPHVGNEPSFLRGKFEKFFNNRKFQKIGYVDYSKFLAQEKKKFVFVKEREYVDLSIKDKKIGYGESFEYYVTSVTKDFQESSRSNGIKVTVEDLTSIRSPTELRVKQLDETQIQLRICVDPRDDVAKAIIYRKSEDEITFKRVASIRNVNDCISIIDGTVQYAKSYVYRVFLENIHGTLSEPSEIETISTVQKITPQSRSNNLKIPIITAVQDQNSDYVKVTISANDPNISWYELQRRDLTIHERKFSVPSKLETNFGKDAPWDSNKFFVQRNRNTVEGKLKKNRDILERRMTQDEVVFVDDTVALNHIYQYRVYGCDLFCNRSSYALTTVRTVGKKAVRTPINLKSTILRGSPLRIKIEWDNDNAATEFSDDEIFANESQIERDANKFIYKVQRRKLGETIYESFPLTANRFIVDETATLDAVDFDGKKREDIFVKTENIEREDETVKVLEKEFRRSFGIPDFLKENDVYFYRILAIDVNKDESNFTKEFEISTLPDLSDPVDFKAEILNTKINPLIARLIWKVEKTKSKADFYVIERKFDVSNDTFEVIGSAYIDTEFFDRDLELGSTYIYRIKAVDTLGRESQFFETRLTL